MSASDKKQQRRATLVDGMTQKQLKDKADADAAKKRRTIYTVVGSVCAVAAIALLVWYAWSSRGENTNAVAATVNGTDYTVADLQYYYIGAKNSEYQLAQMYTAYGMTSPYDYTKDEGEQWYNEDEGKTYADYFRESALDNLSHTAVLCAEAQKAGYTLSDEGKASVQSQLSQIDVVCARYGLTRSSYFAQSYGKGVTEKVFLRNLENDVLAEEYSNYHQEGISYDDAALEDYYSEHKDTLDSYDFRIFPISGAAESTTDTNGNTVDTTDEEKAAAMAAAKEKADAAVARIEAASASEKETAFLAAAQEYVAEESKEAYADSSYSLVEGILGSQLTSNGAAYASWLEDSGRKSGDVAAVEATESYYVVLFLDRYRNNEDTVDFRHILINADTTDSEEKDEDGNTIATAEAMAEARTKAQEIYDEWKSGEATESSFAALANSKSDDSGSNGSSTSYGGTSGGLYTYVDQGDMVPPINDWIFDSSRQPGDTTIVEYTGRYSGVHIVYFVGSQEPAWKGTALSALQQSAQTDWVNALDASVTAEVKDGMSLVGSVSNAVPTPSASPAESAEPTESAAG